MSGDGEAFEQQRVDLFARLSVTVFSESLPNRLFKKKISHDDDLDKIHLYQNMVVMFILLELF